MVVVVNLACIEAGEHGGEAGVVAGGAAHLAKTDGVPDFVTEVFAALDAVFVELHVLAERGDL